MNRNKIFRLAFVWNGIFEGNNPFMFVAHAKLVSKSVTSNDRGRYGGVQPWVIARKLWVKIVTHHGGAVLSFSIISQ